MSQPATTDVPEVEGQAVNLTPAQTMANYKYVVLYEKFCTSCGEPGHVEEDCLRYKTTICKFWERKGCLNANCQYAHGRWELRKPNKFKCARVFEIAPSTYVVRGCGDRNTHTYATCNKQGLLWPPAAPQVTNLNGHNESEKKE